MSVFGHHKNEWVKRFPESELHMTWAEDVRTNLEKHRNKVAVLKEELEKEEFYVKYLEDLLDHAEKHRKLSITEEIGTDHEEEEVCSSGNQNGSAQLDPNERENEQNFNENLTNSTELTHGNDNTARKTAHSVDVMTDCVLIGDKSDAVVNENEKETDFVTVIEVNGFAVELDETKANSNEIEKAQAKTKEKDKLQSVSANNSPVAVKKVPPKPPPKRSIRPVSAQPIATQRPQQMMDSIRTASTAMSRNVVSTSNPSESGTNLKERVETLPNLTCVSPFVARKPLKPKPLLRAGPSSTTESDNLEISSRGSSDSLDQVEDLKPAEVAPAVHGADLDKSCESYDNNTMKSQASNYSGQSGLSDGDCSLLSGSPVSGASFAGGQTSFDGNDDEDDDDGGGEESPKYSDYVNIDYFLKKKLNERHAGGRGERAPPSLRSESVTVDSDDDDRVGVLLLQTLAGYDEYGAVSDSKAIRTNRAQIGGDSHHSTEDIFEADSGVYSSSVESTSFLCPSYPPTPPTSVNRTSESADGSVIENPETTAKRESSEAARITMFKCIISSILESEATYLECLHLLIQYMKALRSTINTSQPVISNEDLSVIFHKIPELHEMHKTFLDGIRNRVQQWDGKLTIGDHFKILASRLSTYESFLQNYPRAIETTRKCSSENAKFSESTKDIKLKALKGQAVTLEDLLHKPVARVQKNALVIHDLLKQTPESHPDHKALKVALRMTQCFLNEFNMSATESMFPVHDRTQRHLVKNSFIVELSEGHRKLRHLFLFNDVVVCAKYKPSGKEKLTYEVKWYISLADVVLPSNDVDDAEAKESNPVNVLSLKSQVATVRDQIMLEENHNKEKASSGGRHMDKHRKKLSELQGQLVLASPNLVFRIGQKSGKTYFFFLSSKFERSQWVEAITVVKAHVPSPSSSLSLYELQTWITTCRKFLQTNMGSFLLKSGKDDSLVGDLHIVLKSLQGLREPADMYLCLEVDSYGHFFRKGKTRVCCKTTEPLWNQEFVIELEGSNFLRILCYEQIQNHEPLLRGRTTIELNKTWLTNRLQEKQISLQDFTLDLGLKYTQCEMSLRRVPSSKPCGVFGVKITHVAKKEKRSIPFLVTCCVREVEKRGLHELGLYRVSGSASDVQKLRRMFESNAYEAEQLLKEMDIHSVTGLFKLYLRELPEGLFTDDLYHKLLDAFGMSDGDAKGKELLRLFQSLPPINKEIVIYLINHMAKINKEEAINKMSLQNLATVFGPTLIRPSAKLESSSASDRLASGTIDVMAQAGILYFYLKKNAAGESILDSEVSQTQM